MRWQRRGSDGEAEANENTTGLVRAPILTTLTQVLSRYLLVWLIAYLFPRVPLSSPLAYSSMLLAWSLTETIRYSYFAVNLAYGGGVPSWLTWLRYNTFFALYPLGIGSECWLIWRSLGPAAVRFGVLGWWGLVVVLGVYVPGESSCLVVVRRAGSMLMVWLVSGSYVLFTHMMAQRRKVMRGNAASAKKRA